MTLVKICAVTNAEDARVVQEAGADLLGLIFAPKSKRCVTVNRAKEIMQALGRTPEPGKLHWQPGKDLWDQIRACSSKPLVVGVFQNQPIDQVRAIADAIGLDIIQLHGDEPPESPIQLSTYPVLRAIGVHPHQPNALQTTQVEMDRHRMYVAGFLLDTKSSPTSFGGAGESFDWTLAARDGGVGPVMVAGGLRPDNVSECIRQSKAIAVDVASGVECVGQVGIKDHDKVRSFVQNAKETTRR